ncbi:prefoldin 6 [Brevipalpus obovatus]|uniref:prefoldin 6 n=1 Tax=Brevipalpus obovatus TaxID=246614 RepID=UPI003D9ECF58
MAAAMETVTKKLSEEVTKFNNLQKELQKVCTTRQQLDEQLNENKIVKEEMDLLEDEANVFKMIGPAMIKQELKDAKDNVNGRIKYISGELKRHDDTIKDIESKQMEQKEVIAKLQAQIKQAQAKVAKP